MCPHRVLKVKHFPDLLIANHGHEKHAERVVRIAVHCQAAIGVNAGGGHGTAGDRPRQPIGVDFALGRLICQENQPAQVAEKCSKSLKYQPRAREVLKITLRGTTPCTEYTQIQAIEAVLSGTVVVTLSDGFVPSHAQEFVIVQAMTSLTGRYAHAEDRLKFNGGSFQIRYEDKSVILGNFIADESSY